MLLAQITDLHATVRGRTSFGVVDTPSCLARAVDALIAHEPRPDAVLVTGDLAFDGRPEEYAVVAEELGRLPMPTLAIPGNHDARGPFRAALVPRFCPSEDPRFLHWAVDLGEVRLIGLDTLVEGQDHGELCAQRLAFLEGELARAAGRPVVLALHHPPFATGIGFMDRIGLAEPGPLERLVRAHGRVERVLCGHVHRSIQCAFGGTVASVAPATAHQVRLALEPGAPSRLTLEPPAFHLHQRTGDRPTVTHTAHVGPWPGPYPFSGEG